MTPQRRIRTLMGITVAGAVVALGALLRAPDVRVAPRPLALAPAGVASAVDVRVDPARVDEVLAGNIFSPQRRRPQQRTMLAVVDGVADSLAPAVAMEGDIAPSAVTDPSVAAAIRTEDAVPRLYGVVSDGRGYAALLRLDRTQPGAALYREGERAGAYAVRRIESDRVWLNGPRGAQSLRLAPRRSVR
jgi:hypothetical protein